MAWVKYITKSWETWEIKASKLLCTCNNLTSFLICLHLLTKLQTLISAKCGRAYITKSMFRQFNHWRTFSFLKKIWEIKASNLLIATIWQVFRMIVVKIICLHFRIDGHHLFWSIPLASRKLHRSQSVDEPVSQISHGNFTNFLAIEVKFCLKFISSNLFNSTDYSFGKTICYQVLLD